MSNFAHGPGAADIETPGTNQLPGGGVHVSTAPGQSPPALDQERPSAAEARQGLLERIYDNLPLWTIVAAAITLLYLVWATLDVISVYTGDVPKVSP